MTDLKQLDGKPLALLLIGEDENGEEDWAVFRGTARWEGTDLHFVRDGVDFAVPDGAVSRIRPVDPGIRDVMLDAEYYIPLSVGPLPAEAVTADFICTGLEWPQH